LLDRLDGVWLSDATKSVSFIGKPPTGGGGGHIYIKDVKRRGIAYNDRNGTSFQVLDGKQYPGPGYVNDDYTVARWPVDEFTTDNMTFRKGKPQAHLMQFMAADGSWKIIVQRPVSDRGEWTPQTISYYRKAPHGTKAW
jgi:hypothetical protein